MRIAVELDRHVTLCQDGEEYVCIRVIVNGVPNNTLARQMRKSEYLSYFEHIWEYMGNEVRRFNIELEMEERKKDKEKDNEG